MTHKPTEETPLEYIARQNLRVKELLSALELARKALEPFATQYDILSERIRIATEERPEITANEVMNLEMQRNMYLKAKEALDTLTTIRGENG